jgi:hypothetical protein
MGDAQRIIHDLEVRRSYIMADVFALADKRGALAYDVVVNSSFAARIERRALENQLERLVSEVELLELALYEAQRRASQRDCTIVNGRDFWIWKIGDRCCRN